MDMMGMCTATQDLWLEDLYKRAWDMGLEEFQSHYMSTPYFKLKITETQTEKALDWKKTRQHLFAYEGLDASFRANHKQFDEYQLELTTFPGVDIELDAKTPRKLTPEKQLEYLNELTTVVSEAVSHSAKAEKAHPMRPRFNIDAIYLDIGNLHIRHDIVQQLQELLALNVTIKKLTIQPTVTPEKSGPLLWRSAWAALLFTICGHPGASVKPGSLSSICTWCSRVSRSKCTTRCARYSSTRRA